MSIGIAVQPLITGTMMRVQDHYTDVGASAPWSAGQGFTEPQTPGTVAYSLGAKHFAGQYAAFWLEKQ